MFKKKYIKKRGSRGLATTFTNPRITPIAERRRRRTALRTVSERVINTLENSHRMHLHYLNVVFQVLRLFFSYVNLPHLFGRHRGDTTIRLLRYLRRVRRNGINVAFLLNRLINLHNIPGRYVFDETLRPAIMRSIQRFGDTWFLILISELINYIHERPYYYHLLRLGRGSFAWGVGGVQEYWLDPFCSYPMAGIPGRCLEGVIYDIRNILGILLFMRMTSTSANQYLINFRIGFFANIGSRHGLDLLNRDIQVWSFRSIMLTPHHANHFMGLDCRFQHLNEKLAVQHRYSISSSFTMFSYKLCIYNLLQNLDFDINTLLHPIFFKCLKKHMFDIDLKNKGNTPADLPNNPKTNNNKKHMYKKLSHIFYKVCGGVLSFIKFATLCCICLSFASMSFYLLKFGILDFLDFFGWKRFNISYCLDIFNGNIWEVGKLEGKSYFLPKELIDQYLNKRNFIPNSGLGVSSDTLPQLNNCTPTDIHSDADTSTDCSDDGSDND